MNINLAIFLMATVVNVVLVLLVVIKKRPDIKNAIVATFVLSVVFFIGWFITNYLADTSVDAFNGLLWTRLTVPFSLLALWFLLWFSYIFPVKAVKYKSMLAVYLFLVVVLSLFSSLSSQIFQSVQIKEGVGVSKMVLGPLYIWMIGLYLLLILTTIYNFIKSYRRVKGVFKIQVRYVLLGWVLFLFGGAIFSLIIPYLASSADGTKYGPLFSILMTGAMAYAIIRHRFLDIRIIIQRGIIYTLLLGIVVGFYLLTLFVLGNLFQQTTNTSFVLSSIFTVVIGIFGVPPIDKYLRKATDKIFFKEKYDYSEALHTLSHILNRTIEKEEVITQAGKTLMQILKASKVLFLLTAQENKENFSPELVEYFKRHNDVIISADIFEILKDESLETNIRNSFENLATIARRHEANVIVPIVLEQNLVAVMLLGPRKSGDSFSMEDIKLLKTFSYQAAVALSKAQLYSQVKEYSESLEEKVKQRTEEQRQMIIDISHNLQTPLTVVKGELEILQKTNSNNKNLKTFEQSIDSISQFISNLLKLARLEHGAESLSMTQLDLSKLLVELAEYFKVVAQEKGISLETNIQRDVVIKGDKDKLTELVTNLVSNAMKYIGGKKEITISLQKSGKSAELGVANTGKGIEAEDLPYIFKRFYRAKGGGSGISGSGLGLAICRQIAEKHNGTVEVGSKEGEGAKFILRLPLF